MFIIAIGTLGGVFFVWAEIEQYKKIWDDLYKMVWISSVSFVAVLGDLIREYLPLNLILMILLINVGKHDINKIAVNSQAQLIRQRQSEQAYKRLMTSLSHDVKTPLASLVGYLEAVENKIVIGEEKDEYIHVAHEKAHYMKSFVENLFEWVKLDSGEQIFHFEKFDLNELSRNIIADWIPVLESNHFEYEFVIPETEYFIHIDVNAYTRVLNNLFQNIIIHSAGDKMALHICEDIQQAKIIISDNGKGIAPDKLPHIFERMYQCDQSRSAKGNGLGLAIAKELISVHKGTITAENSSDKGTVFTILLPKAL